MSIHCVHCKEEVKYNDLVYSECDHPYCKSCLDDVLLHDCCCSICHREFPKSEEYYKYWEKIRNENWQNMSEKEKEEYQKRQVQTSQAVLQLVMNQGKQDLMLKR